MVKAWRVSFPYPHTTLRLHVPYNDVAATAETVLNHPESTCTKVVHRDEALGAAAS